MENWKPLQRYFTGHFQYRVLQYFFLYAAFVFPVYVSKVSFGLSLEGHTGFFFGARFGCLYWLVGPPPSSSTSSFGLRHARSRSPASLKTPLVRLRPRGDVSPVVTGALPVPLSARCVSCQFPFLFNNNFPCPLIIHRVRSGGS